MKVYILLESWNNSGDNGVNHIKGVYSTLKGAQIALCDAINMDEQYGGYEHMEANSDIKDFDLYHAAKEGLPIPCTYIRYWDGDWICSERTLEYAIEECNVIEEI